MVLDAALKNEFDRVGRVWLRGAISEAELAQFDAAAALESKAGARIKASGPLVARQSALCQAISRLDPGAKPVRVVAFNKTPATNWGVPWHQDRVIAVAARQDVPGFGNWTKKSDVWHCEPPQNILDEMLFVRVHLDDTDQANGAMEIALGSHISGLVPAACAAQVAGAYPVETCTAKRGDVLVLKMLTLHGSKPSKTASNRRVFRIDFAASDLPAPLAWH